MWLRLSATEALERAELFDEPSRVTLLTVMNRPAYRFAAGRESTTVFADTGDLLVDIDAAQAQRVAAAFVRLPESRLHYVARLTSPDQWSLTIRRGPMHKFTLPRRAGAVAGPAREARRPGSDVALHRSPHEPTGRTSIDSIASSAGCSTGFTASTSRSGTTGGRSGMWE